MGESGVIPFVDRREEIASAVAGALAEAGIARLEVGDPRTCGKYTLKARESDLPKTLLEAAAGTTLSGEGVALLVDEREIRWVAEGVVASLLRALTAG
ncbi:MAG TPA: hypothetical protein VHC70_08525 [Phycisphaerales bacterium]|nr:hypothetical protein [Phycisphaerales bacterium]